MKGFTLVETLVAIFVFGLVSTGLVSLLTVSLRSNDVLVSASDTLRALERSRALMRADFGQLVDRPARNETGNWVLPLDMDEEAEDFALEFVRLGWDNPDAAPRGDLQKIRYVLEDGALYRLSAPQLDGAALAQRLLLVPDVKDVQARVFQDSRWRSAENYDPRLGPPLAVEFILETARFGTLVQRHVTPFLSRPPRAAQS